MKVSIFTTTAALLLILYSFAGAEDSATVAAPADEGTTAIDTSNAVSTDSATLDPATKAAVPETQPPAIREKGRGMVIVRENLDTVFIFDKSVFRYVVKDWRNNIDIFRQRGYGVGGCSMYGANAIFTGPIKDLAENDPHLSGKRFDFGKYAFEPFLVSGGAGFVGLGEGFRLGGGGMSGERHFTSNQYNGDSILVLNTKVGYGGFLIEKCILQGKWNLSAGGEIGAGSFNVTLSEQAKTVFYGDFDEEFDLDRKNNSSRSVFFMLEPHAGFTYTFFFFFHIGGAISMPMFMSVKKFSAYTDDYFTVNPGLHFKFIFGNLG